MLNFDVVQVTFLIILTVAIVLFFFEWSKSRRENRLFKRDELKLKRYEIESNSQSAKINVQTNNSTPQESKTDLNGYVFMSIDEDKKSMFSEMLKGFEEYAKLKGYQVSLSVDTSAKGKIGFKFTLHEDGVSVSTQKVKTDINEYIHLVMSGGNFDDIPILITPEEHSAVIGTLKARLTYMEYTHSLEKEDKEFYKNLITKMAGSSIGHAPANINLIQEGIGMDGRSYSANNSANIVQGDESNSSIENSNIQIGRNVSEINSQIDELNKTLKALENEATNNKELKPVIRHLENAREELEESRSPDGVKIAGWLDKANSVMETVKTTTETASKLTGLLTIFGVSV